MAVGLCTIHLSLPESHSLKAKRGVLKSLLARLRHEFNVSVAEVGENDLWQSATIGVVAVSSDAAYVQGLLERTVHWIEVHRLDVTVEDYAIEML
ncbi:MAG: DUF503 domain-containing protein [Anaerolineae bacterium]